jgi:predicted transglutaminase-like cysteine proteinase
MVRALAIGVFALSAAQVAAGQSAERAPEGGAAQRGGAKGRGANRAGLELQLRQKFAQRARVQLGLSPDQMVKLEDVNRRFGQQVRALDQREMQTRQSLRQALLEAPSADQDKRVGDLHDQLMQVQRQRLDLISAEHKELGGFMTNVQRVRFQALQENFRRQLQDGLRQQSPPRPGPQPI